MKKVLLTLVLALIALGARAQDQADSLYVPAAIDSTLRGQDILNLIRAADGKSEIDQPAAIRDAFRKYVSRNAGKPMSGYRIRVYFDNDQKARARSEAVARTIAGRYPGLRVYRTFESPNFKVSVGDFRSKDEALRLFNELKVQYPSAFLMKENINYPLVDPDVIFQ